LAAWRRYEQYNSSRRVRNALANGTATGDLRTDIENGYLSLPGWKLRQGSTGSTLDKSLRACHGSTAFKLREPHLVLGNAMPRPDVGS